MSALTAILSLRGLGVGITLIGTAAVAASHASWLKTSHGSGLKPKRALLGSPHALNSDSEPLAFPTQLARKKCLQRENNILFTSPAFSSLVVAVLIERSDTLNSKGNPLFPKSEAVKLISIREILHLVPQNIFVKFCTECFPKFCNPIIKDVNGSVIFRENGINSI